MDMRRVATAAALAGLVLAGGLGACGDDGRATGGRTDAAGRPLLPVSLTASGGASTAAASAAVAEDAVGRTMIAPVQPVEHRLAPGAEAPAASAPAYRFVPGAGDERTIVEALGGDRAASIEVRRGIWFFHRSPDAAVSSSAPADCVGDGCAPDRLPPPPPGVPGEGEAEARARAILAELGIDPSAGIFESSADPYRVQVWFRPEVAGLPVEGLEQTIAFGEQGRIEFASGYVGRFTEMGDYPLVGMEEAIRRLQEPRDAPVAATEPHPVAPDAPLEPTIVEVTGAELVLSVVRPPCEDGDVVLVPAFRLLPEEAVSVTVPAVQEASLAAGGGAADGNEPCAGRGEPDRPVGRPEADPMPPPGGPGEEMGR